MEKSPSPVYGARLELVYALIAHRGFESLLLRQWLLQDSCRSFCFVRYPQNCYDNSPADFFAFANFNKKCNVLKFIAKNACNQNCTVL